MKDAEALMERDDPKTAAQALNEVPSSAPEQPGAATPPPPPAEAVTPPPPPASDAAVPSPPPVSGSQPPTDAQPNQANQSQFLQDQFERNQLSSPHAHQRPTRKPGGPGPSKPEIGKAIGKGFLIKGAIVGVLLVVGFIFTRGTTSASALEVGDCFILGDDVEISRLETPDCTESHDSQVVGFVELEGPEAYPGRADPYWEEVFFQCEDAAFATMTNIDLLPQDVRVDFISPSEQGWDNGDRESICLIHAPGGLSGSFTSIPS